MNSRTYLKLITNRYGGLLKSDLELKLRRLVDLAIREQLHEKSSTVNQFSNTPVQRPVEKPVSVQTHTNRDQNLSSYEKAMDLIRNINGTGWKHISEVPDTLFKDFWAIAEMHPEIIFDEERQWQYFKVESFTSKSYMDRKGKELENVA